MPHVIMRNDKQKNRYTRTIPADSRVLKRGIPKTWGLANGPGLGSMQGEWPGKDPTEADERDELREEGLEVYLLVQLCAAAPERADRPQVCPS